MLTEAVRARYFWVMRIQPRVSTFAFVFLGALACHCDQAEKSLAPSQPEAPQAPASAVDTERLAFEGAPPPGLDPAQVPGADGSFVEPALVDRPQEIHHVVVGTETSLDSAARLGKKTAAVAAVPVGYPGLEQAALLGSAPGGWSVVAGKFARLAYARALASVLRKNGFTKSKVVSRPYRHNRFQPAQNSLPGPRSGLVFAGVTDMEVALLSRPDRESSGAGVSVVDGTWLEVESVEEGPDGLWYRVRSSAGAGFLPAARVLTDYNVYPAADGKRAVLAISLGCGGGTCRWDYWLVGRAYRQRRLLGPGAERLTHAFSPDGSRVAFASAGRPLTLILGKDRGDHRLGPGISPSWSPDGRRLYFRRPGAGKIRDAIMVADAPDFKPQNLYDFPGEPFYPRALSAYPPAVDVLEGGAKLHTMFYRLVRRDGGYAVHRWKVWLSADGKLLGKKGEQMTSSADRP